MIPTDTPAPAGPATVTVIVPGRDVADFAGEALASLRAQTLTTWRALLIDDASVDATGDIFDAAAADDDRFRVVHLPASVGLGAARNLGLDLVDTPLVAFFDADDVMTPTALERMAGTLAETGSDFAVGAYVRLRPRDDGYAPGEVQRWVAASTQPERRRTTLREHPDAAGNIVAWSKVSRVEFWRRTGLRFAEGRRYEDQVVAQHMYARARAFDVVPDVLVHWRERADGSSITQRAHALTVLGDYLHGLSTGLSVLDAADQRAAARTRARLILEMDLPPLVHTAQRHDDARYRRTLGAFVRELLARPDLDPAVDPAAMALADAARLW